MDAITVIAGIIIIALGYATWYFWPDRTKKEKEEEKEKFTTNEEILVPVDTSSITPKYTTMIQNENSNTMGYEDIPNKLHDRGYVTYPMNDYPPNPDLYPENGREFIPENSMYTHLENNFLDIGPQIGVGTRVASHRNAPTLNFRKQYAVPTMPTGYWNQSTISQPIYTNNVC